MTLLLFLIFFPVRLVFALVVLPFVLVGRTVKVWVETIAEQVMFVMGGV